MVLTMPRAADWIKTKTQFVYRHKQSGRYYVRAYRQGREVWRALETDVYEVARTKAKDTLAEIHRPRILSAAIGDKRTFGAVAELYLERVKHTTSTKPSTHIGRSVSRHYFGAGRGLRSCA